MSVRVVCHKPIGNGISFVATRCWRAKMINTRNDFSHWKQFFSLFVRFIHVVCRWCPLATLSTPPSERTKSISHRKTLNAMKFSCSHSVVWFSHKLKRMLTSGVRNRWKRENRHTLNLLKWNKQDNDESNLSISRRMRRDTAEWEREQKCTANTTGFEIKSLRCHFHYVLSTLRIFGIVWYLISF